MAVPVVKPKRKPTAREKGWHPPSCEVAGLPEHELCGSQACTRAGVHCACHSTHPPGSPDKYEAMASLMAVRAVRDMFDVGLLRCPHYNSEALRAERIVSTAFRAALAGMPDPAKYAVDPYGLRMLRRDLETWLSREDAMEANRGR